VKVRHYVPGFGVNVPTALSILGSSEPLCLVVEFVRFAYLLLFYNWSKTPLLFGLSKEYPLSILYLFSASC